MSQWIWKFGEFELYHSMLLHNRRQQYGYAEVPVWKIYPTEPVVRFSREVTTEGGTFYVTACGNFTVEVTEENGTLLKFRGRREIELPAGTCTVSVRVANYHTFPCLYIDGVIETDGDWMADDVTEDRAPVGTSGGFDSPDRTPEVFPFAYEAVTPVEQRVVKGGILFDFGKETFARTRITVREAESLVPVNTGQSEAEGTVPVSFGKAESPVLVSFGESEEEALDEEWSVVHFQDRPKDGVLEYPPYAFRYLYVKNETARVAAEYEYLPLAYRGAFHCDDELLNQIWEVAAYTFHLNCREFFLDGIKRDRWVWSGDAYQSLFVNHYLFMDQEIEKRTLIALGGKAPFKQHINTIMDYTFFWVMGCYEYYKTYGDVKFLEQIYPQLKEILAFCGARADEDGFLREKPGDWIFIDWAPMDKTGALCAEQILYARALHCYVQICEIIGADSGDCREREAQLVRQIFEKFYDAGLGGFIDSYESGKRNISRQNNLIAYLFLPCSSRQKRDIYEKVILNDAVQQITTPYFKFYENLVHMEEGNDAMLEQSLREYYGGMLKEGATTFFEEYDPEKKGAEHYAMYGNPYEKSLCHAWSASPIYLLGRYRMGVKNVDVAYRHFEVEPKLGGLQHFSGRVPLPEGWVDVSVNGETVEVLTNAPGGELLVKGERIPLEVNKKISLDICRKRR